MNIKYDHPTRAIIPFTLFSCLILYSDGTMIGKTLHSLKEVGELGVPSL